MSSEVKDRTGKGEESFAELFESYGASRSEDIRVGDKVRGEIISIGRESVFIDTGSKIDGVVDKEELLDEHGEIPYKEGDILELYVVSRRENEVRLSRAISGIGGLSLLRDAFDKGIPVEGKVRGPCKGGFHVEIMHLKAFCPLSQVDLQFVENPEGYVGKTYRFVITHFEEDGGNIVVSRRELLHRELEEEREKFQRALAAGVELEGKVTRLVPYGAFVELFPGIEGMVHLSELSWSRVEKPEEVLKRGDKLKVKVIEIEEGERAGHLRISLSIKRLTGDPWDTVEERFNEGDRATGKVTRCAEFGAFVEIAPGIEGMVHISELSYTKRVLRPEDVVKVGKVVPVVVKEVDAARRRISLSIRDAEGDPWMDIEEKYHVGQVVQGTIEKKEQFGYFVALEPGITGLLPSSNVAKSSNPRSIEKLRQGDPIEVVIEVIRPDERRITLGPGDARDEQDWRSFARDAGKPLGSLGEKLHQALKSKREP